MGVCWGVRVLGRCSLTLGRPAAPGCFGVPSVLLAKTAHGRYALACPAASPDCFGALRSFSQRRGALLRLSSQRHPPAPRTNVPLSLRGGGPTTWQSGVAWETVLLATRAAGRAAPLPQIASAFLRLSSQRRGAWCGMTHGRAPLPQIASALCGASRNDSGAGVTSRNDGGGCRKGGSGLGSVVGF